MVKMSTHGGDPAGADSEALSLSCLACHLGHSVGTSVSLCRGHRETCPGLYYSSAAVLGFYPQIPTLPCSFGCQPHHGFLRLVYLCDLLLCEVKSGAYSVPCACPSPFPHTYVTWPVTSYPAGHFHSHWCPCRIRTCSCFLACF